MSEAPSNSDSDIRPRRFTIVAAGLLLLALALVVIYTNHGAFLSPLALVVVAAIGVAALLLQFRLQPGVAVSTGRGPLLLNGIGVAFALLAVLADFIHFNPAFMLIAALVAVVSFAISGILVLSTIRKRRV
ncbi:MAG TPA: hypothetical protein VK722_16150 [Candidatus Aquilonibacter sp.]|nr:hypothetical protein [Candidatus Aquilonibacter sp.]